MSATNHCFSDLESTCAPRTPMTYQQNTQNEDFPDDCYHLVLDQRDPRAARNAYKSTTALLEYRARNQAGLPFLCSLDLDNVTHHTLTFAETLRLVVQFAKSHAKHLPARKSKLQQALVVGLVASSSVDYWINDRAIEYLGHTSLHLSTTLAHSTVSNLLSSTGASSVLIGPGNETLRTWLEQNRSEIAIIPWIDIRSALPYEAGDEELYRSHLSVEEETEETALILHTTGSTADPKPIPMRHRAFCNMSPPSLPGSRLCVTPASHALTSFHAQSALARAEPIFICPSIPYDAQHLIKALNACEGRVDVFAAVPHFINVLAGDPHGLSALKKLREVHVTGGQLSPAVGDVLCAAGIKIFIFVASSETVITLDSGSAKSSDWMWVAPLALLSEYVYFQPFDAESGAHELMVRAQCPHLFVTNHVDGLYASGDLFLPHPTEPNRWRYDRRKDEVLVHSTGVKSDPLAIEHALVASPLIQHALAVGHGKPHVGVLVVPATVGVTLPMLEPLLTDLNARLPSQSRIQSERIRILSPEDSLVLSPKGTVIRRKTEDKLANLIAEMYS